MRTIPRVRHAAVAIALMAASAAWAQTYPSKPFEIVVHTGPGAGNDRVARIFVDIVQREKPTFKELGYDIHFGSARGFAMPAAVPRESVQHMEALLERVYHSAGWKAHAQQSNYENVWLGSAGFSQYLVQRRVQSQEFLRAIGAIPKS